MNRGGSSWRRRTSWGRGGGWCASRRWRASFRWCCCCSGRGCRGGRDVLAYPTTPGAEPNAPLVVYDDGMDAIIHQTGVVSIIGRPGSPIELAYPSITGTEPLVNLPVYGDGIDRRAYKSIRAGDIGCPGAVVESAGRSSVTSEQPRTPLVSDTPSKPLHIGAVYAEIYFNAGSEL